MMTGRIAGNIIRIIFTVKQNDAEMETLFSSHMYYLTENKFNIHILIQTYIKKQKMK